MLLSVSKLVCKSDGVPLKMHSKNLPLFCLDLKHLVPYRHNININILPKEMLLNNLLSCHREHKNIRLFSFTMLLVQTMSTSPVFNNKLENKTSRFLYYNYYLRLASWKWIFPVFFLNIVLFFCYLAHVLLRNRDRSVFVAETQFETCFFSISSPDKTLHIYCTIAVNFQGLAGLERQSTLLDFWLVLLLKILL